MDKLTIAEFWKTRAAYGTTRWTGSELLDFDTALAGSFVRPAARILDLGSGFGELSRAICPPDGSVLAVDSEPAMAAGFQGDPRFEFVAADVLSFRPPHRFDLVLLFGVMNYFEAAEMMDLVEILESAVDPRGVVLVKNQCSDDVGFAVDVDFQGTGQRYIARYPGVAEEVETLKKRFPHVEVVPYPPQFKQHATSTHVAFICRLEDPPAPRRAGPRAGSGSLIPSDGGGG